jgi:ABC-type glycerol-3-phosphate transport system substrate-binding protein
MNRSSLLAAVVGLAGLVGCEDDLGDPAPRPVTLTYYRHDDLAVAAADREGLAAYRKAHPHIDFEEKILNYNALVALLESDLPVDALKADLINMPPSYACGYAEHLTPVPGSLLTLEQARQTFLPAPLEGVTCGDKLVGLPREYNLEYGGILVNMTRYRAKLPDRSPADWNSWADVIRDAVALTETAADGKVTLAGLDFRHRAPMKHIFLALILQQAGQFWNVDHSGFQFDTAEARAAIQWMMDAAKANQYLDPAGPAAVTGPWALALVDERAVMVYTGTWGHAIATEAAANAGKQMELAYFRHPPFFGSEHTFVQNSGWSLVVPRTSAHPAEAMDVVRFLTADPDAVRNWNALAGSISPLRAHSAEGAGEVDPVRSAVRPLLEKGRWVGYMPPVPLTETRDSFYNNALQAMKGEIDAAEAARRIHAECNASMMRSRNN